MEKWECLEGDMNFSLRIRVELGSELWELYQELMQSKDCVLSALLPHLIPGPLTTGGQYVFAE